MAAIAVACGGAGGGSSSSSPTTPSTPTSTTTNTFAGTIAGPAGESGTVSVTIQLTTTISSAVVQPARTLTIAPLSITEAAGVLALAGTSSTVALAGSFNSSSNTLSLSGGGYSFTGLMSGAVLAGSFTGPTGSGSFSSLNTSPGGVTLYCGTFRGISDSGVWNLQLAASGAMSGDAVSPNEGAITLTGQLTGTALTLVSSQGKTATGTIQNGVVNGSYSSGTFSGSAGTSCSVPPAPPPPTGPFAFTMTLSGTNSGGGLSFTTNIEGQTISAPGAYNLVLPAGIYTLTGQVETFGNLTVLFTAPFNSGGGVANGSVQGTFGCGPYANCAVPQLSWACSAPTPPGACYPYGTTGKQQINNCGAYYAAVTAGSNCTQDPKTGACLVYPNPLGSLTFQLQFTVGTSNICS